MPAPRWIAWLLGKGPSRLWAIHLAAFTLLILALLCDAGTVHLAEGLLAGEVPARAYLQAQLRGDLVDQLRLGLLAAAAIVAVGTGAALALGAVAGPASYRSLQAWLVGVGLLCLWLALAVGWREIAWTGRRARAAALVEHVQPIADRLQQEWPTIDGEFPETGPFMAYPAAAPATLILLAPPAIGGARSTVQLVERTADGALHFQLGGAEFGVWLVRSATGSRPESFQGGLGQQYDLRRSRRLNHAWWAATYEARPATP